MDSRSTPQGIGRGHPSDQGFDRAVDGRVARRATPGKRAPVAAKAASLPAQHSGGSHDDEGLPPGGPYPGQPDPKEPIAPLELRPVHRSLVDGQLLPQGEVLEGELAVAPAEEREESKSVEQEGDHRTGILSGSEQTDQSLAHRTEFWRRTGCSVRAHYRSDPRTRRNSNRTHGNSRPLARIELFAGHRC